MSARRVRDGPGSSDLERYGGQGAEGEDDDPKRPPSAPRNVTLTPGDEQIEVSWDAPRDMGDPEAWIGYVVESRQVGEDNWF